jgi:peptidoglycan hydrolase-like protein with peptidoglycan-binding domain
MKNALRATVLACAAVIVSFSISTSPVRADDSSDAVRDAQMHLASMGYYIGRYDGEMNTLTQQAVMDFQRTNGLLVTGNLSPETASLMNHMDHQAEQQASAPAQMDPGAVAQQIAMTTITPTVLDNYWNSYRTQIVPSRYGKLEIKEDDRGTMRHYQVTVNDRPVLFADNQPQLLRVSKTYAMKDEDAVVLTAYSGDSACSYKSYLMTIHSDGSYNLPQEIGNCANHFQAHLVNSTLMISFPGNHIANGWPTWDVWQYKNNTLAHT